MARVKLGGFPAKSYRGSKRRVHRIRMRDSWSTELLIVIALMLLILGVGIPWLIHHPPADVASVVIQEP
jgi:hypothetical protein